MEFAPIVVFAYNRPHYLEQTLNALRKNDEAAKSDLFIYCDGPKDNADAAGIALVNQVRQLAHQQNWCKNLVVKESPTNKGLSASVISGVTEVVNKYGKIIVLEDDIVVAPYFLKYMNKALDIYKNEDKVASVSGHNFPVKNITDGKQTLFLRSASTWGWATWKRGWDLFNAGAGLLMNKLKEKDLIYKFNFNNNYPFYGLLEKTKSGKISSWGVCWYASLFLNEKLTVFPFLSMVRNIGMVGTNINSDSTKFIGDEYYEGMIVNFESDINESPAFREAMISHFKKNAPQKFTLHNLNRLFLNVIKRVNL